MAPGRDLLALGIEGPCKPLLRGHYSDHSLGKRYSVTCSVTPSVSPLQTDSLPTVGERLSNPLAFELRKSDFKSSFGRGPHKRGAPQTATPLPHLRRFAQFKGSTQTDTPLTWTPKTGVCPFGFEIGKGLLNFRAPPQSEEVCGHRTHTDVLRHHRLLHISLDLGRSHTSAYAKKSPLKAGFRKAMLLSLSPGRLPRRRYRFLDKCSLICRAEKCTIKRVPNIDWHWERCP